MRFIILAAAAVALSAAPARGADQVLGVGGSLDAQGCAHSAGVERTYTIALDYRLALPEFGFEFAGEVVDKPRGSDCTRQGLAIDVLGSKTYSDFPGGMFLDLDIGYDEHGVTGFDAGDRLVFGRAKLETAAAMFGREFEAGGAAVRTKWGWNIPTRSPRWVVEVDIGEHITAGIDCAGTGGADPYCDGRVEWARQFGGRDGDPDPWGVRIAYDHANGIEFLPDPFAGRADAPAAGERNSLTVELTRRIGPRQ